MEIEVTEGLGRVVAATACAVVLAVAGIAGAIASSSAHEDATVAGPSVSSSVR